MKTILALMVVLLLCRGLAYAQTPPPAEEPVREGLTFGIGLGVGSLRADCEDCRAVSEAGGLHAHIGWMISQRFAIVLDVWGMAHREGFLTVYQNINTLAGQFWPTPKLWLKLGFGNANAGYEWHGIFVDREDKAEAAAGFMFAVGYEILNRSNYALDLQARYGTGLYNTEVGDEYVIEAHNISLGAAISWF